MQLFSPLLSRCFLALFTLYMFSSCNNGNADQQARVAPEKSTAKQGTSLVFNTDPTTVVKDFNTWWTYYYQQVNLSEDFMALGTDSTRMNKEDFLRELTTGKYIPIRLGVKDGESSYQLYLLHSRKTEIAGVMKEDALRVLKNYGMEGTQMPSFSFVDLQGKKYDPKNTAGKTMVLKVWFIHCVACVQEFPELNKLVDEYKGETDVLFVSLAMDAKPALQEFLKTREFKYAVVADEKRFIMDDLHATQFPTHIIIDKKGTIRKVVTRCEEMVPALRKLTRES